MSKIKTTSIKYKGTALAVSLALTTGLTGCASITDHPYEPQDPLQTINRASFEFNEQFDRFLLKPLAEGYKWITPAVVRDGVNNFYWNLDEIPTTINNVLQFEPKAALTSAARLLINSTVGILGIFDVASRVGFQRMPNDFGITLAKYGFTGSPYFVIPFLGPSNVRDGFGLGIDYYLSVYPYIKSVRARNILLGVDYVRIRANYLGNEDVMEVAGMDKYILLRDAYMQRRLLQLQQHGTTWDQAAKYYNVGDEELSEDDDWAMDGSLITEPPLKPAKTDKKETTDDKKAADKKPESSETKVEVPLKAE